MLRSWESEISKRSELEILQTWSRESEIVESWSRIFYLQLCNPGFKGTQQRLFNANQCAIFVPCAAHSLNFVEQSAVVCRQLQ